MIIHQPIHKSIETFFASHQYTQVVVIVDENTKKHCYPLIKNFLPKHKIIQIKSGEEQKHLETCSRIWHQLTDFQLDRKALLINLGGGVIGDMGGFCAATYKRGIEFIQIPTTLLAQVDAASGGKLGIDFNGLKNHIGVFRLPEAVLIDTVFFKTLPEKEIRSGFAEVVKHCLIADAEKWSKIKRKDFQDQNWEELVPHSVAIKEKITITDPTEKGIRKVLNFGHTIGHAIESFCLSKPKRKVLHGEAIAAGMICESFLSVKKKHLSEESHEQIEEFLFSVYGRIKLDKNELNEIAQLTLQDKKNAAGKVNCVLLQEIGKPIYDQQISIKEVIDALEFYIG